jgi:hypothetical protein
MTFGTQDGKPIVWQIISEDYRERILLSESILDTMPYNETNDTADWKESTLFDYLNSDFVNEHFDEKERETLLPVNDDEEDPGVVTMLSISNLIDLYGDIYYADGTFYNNTDEFNANAGMVAKPLDRALHNDIEIFDNEVFAGLVGNGKFDERFNFANGNSPYWVLDKVDNEEKGIEGNFVYYVMPMGYIDYMEPSRLYIGIRPVIRIKR